MFFQKDEKWAKTNLIHDNVITSRGVKKLFSYQLGQCYRPLYNVISHIVSLGQPLSLGLFEKLTYPAESAHFSREKKSNPMLVSDRKLENSQHGHFEPKIGFLWSLRMHKVGFPSFTKGPISGVRKVGLRARHLYDFYQIFDQTYLENQKQ